MERTPMSKWIHKAVLQVLASFILVVVLATTIQTRSVSLPPNVLKVYNYDRGISSQYIGACEGNGDFKRSDLLDLNINTYRIYGGMSRWEATDDDGIYGYPTIAQIKADPNSINWEWWDTVMTYPENGTDYNFSAPSDRVWQGNARDLFRTLKENQIRPVVTLRNSDPEWQPEWATQLNPPDSDADWNEWWEHVFATVYWFNVRNDYRVDDWEVHNEPNNLDQGWGGSQDEYFELMRVTQEAIAYVYQTYLPDRTYHIHAPTTTGGSSWPAATLNEVPEYFDSVNVHDYEADVSSYIQQVRSWMQPSIHAHSPLWLGEWGTYTTGYDDLGFSLNLIQNLIRMSQPGSHYVDGSHLFPLYNWEGEKGFEGLIDTDGRHRLSYYAFRM